MIIYSGRPTWKVFYLARCWEANGFSKAKLSLQNPLWDANLKTALLPSSLIRQSGPAWSWLCEFACLGKERFPESTAEQGATGLMIQVLLLPLMVFTNSCFPESCPCLGASPVAGTQPLGGFHQKQEAATAVESNPSPGYCAGRPAIIYQRYLIRHRSFWDGPKLESISLNLDLQFLFAWDCWDHVLICWIQWKHQ